jgi:threonine dehydrogenase-like Zn-dependent dehydrogenase
MGVEQIVVTDRFSHRLEAASQLGATTAILATEDGDERSAVEEATSTGLDAVFETAGTDSALNTALVAARPGAEVTIVGIPNRDHTSLVASIARRKELTIAFCRRMLPADLVRAATLAGDGSVQLSGLITHRYPLSETGSAFTTLHQRSGLKVIVEP